MGKSGDIIRGTVLVCVVVTDIVSLLPSSLRLALEARGVASVTKTALSNSDQSAMRETKVGSR